MSRPRQSLSPHLCGGGTAGEQPPQSEPTIASFLDAAFRFVSAHGPTLTSTLGSNVGRPAATKSSIRVLLLTDPLSRFELFGVGTDLRVTVRGHSSSALLVPRAPPPPEVSNTNFAAAAAAADNGFARPLTRTQARKASRLRAAARLLAEDSEAAQSGAYSAGLGPAFLLPPKRTPSSSSAAAAVLAAAVAASGGGGVTLPLSSTSRLCAPSRTASAAESCDLAAAFLATQPSDGVLLSVIGQNVGIPIGSPGRIYTILLNDALARFEFSTLRGVVSIKLRSLTNNQAFMASLLQKQQQQQQLRKPPPVLNPEDDNLYVGDDEAEYEALLRG